MNSNEISMLQMWESLSQVNQYGLFKRLLPVSQFFRVFLTFQYPEKYCGIAFVIENKQPLDLKAFDNFSDIRVELIKDGCSSFLSIQLLSSTNKDVFSSLCLDLVRTIAYEDNEDRRVKLILNQLMKWNALFSKKRCEGLSLSEQQGLFGELCLLKKALLGKRECRGTILESWVGVERALRDFQGRSWAIEVKTSKSANPQNIKINSERQLDETFFDNLFLYHCSLEISKNNGTSLIELVESIKNDFNDNLMLQHLFSIKLMTAGYFDEHARLYEMQRYQVRKESFFRIIGDFPRIKESDLRDGVGDIEYSISIANCEKYKVLEKEALSYMGVV